ncbi:hypothetical protein [Flavilitoribacter nigricans]|uniref:Uncharacterized protein n=1 Tax=Flavilitoribacter nigricans (strain ATCC 23147 / DSM 23189 / NBRC 102662 / NCIMB 1420 / SS-2) TaxID=1122177 RepID=A0A2D0NDH7_FLAN2|nr:hypothetical protein [Flavilitoribacter nigricans]PHN06458.1 hypothetical protein CRP01_12890 [Flavilitoribacter nigricans DSM 23189 = NBRC 102662]
MFDKIMRIIGISFAAFWMIFTFLEYWQYHEEARRALDFFQYSELVLVLLPVGALLVFLFHRFRGQKWMDYTSSGLGLTVISLLLSLVLINGFFYENLGSFLSITENTTFLGTLLGVAGGVYFIVLVVYANGRALRQIFAPDLSLSAPGLVFVALGIIALVTLLFILGIFGGLFGFILWPLLLFTLFLSWRSAWHFIQISLLRPIGIFKDLNILGLSIYYLLGLFVLMNFIQVARPYPTGFDAMTFYVNLSSLIRDYHGLVQGHGAYNWSLFMALGLLLYSKISITLSLSFLGSLLSLFALYNLGRKWLDGNYSLLVLFIFYTIPMISWLSYRDMKVDMGLLFYSLLIVSVLVEWLRPAPAPPKREVPLKAVKKIKNKKVSKNSSPPGAGFRKWLEPYLPAIFREHPHLVLIGILTGFALGIKLSALIILLALIPAIAYAKGNWMAFGATTSLSMAFVLIARLDSQAALRPLHLWADQLQWLLLLIGLGLSVYLFLKHKAIFLRILRMAMVCAVLSGLFLSPWLIKNVVESRSLSVSGLTNGKTASPSPGIQEIKEIYQNQQNGN